MLDAMLAMNASSPNGSQSLLAMPNVSGNASGMNASSNVTSLHALPEDWASPFMLHCVLALAILANSFLYISPLSSAMRAFREQVEMKSLASWLAPTYLIFAQSYLWACYGYSTGLYDLARFNGFGAIICMSYLGLIAAYARPREVAQPLIVVSIFAMLLFSLGVLATSSSAASRCRTFGYSAAVFNLGMIFAPLPDAIRVVRTGALEEFPILITVASFFSSLLWAQYAVLVHDNLYLIPNFIGANFCAVELVMVYWMVWGGGASRGGAENFLDVENQPLMPRARGKKTSLSSCSNFVSYLTGGSRSQRRAGDRSMPKDGSMAKNLYDHWYGRSPGTKLWEKSPYGVFGSNSPSTPLSKKPTPTMASKPQFMKSPFSAFDRPEGLESFADGQEEHQANFEANPRVARFGYYPNGFVDGDRPSGGAGASFKSMGYGCTNGAMDCIL